MKPIRINKTKSWIQLASELEVDRKSLQRWRTQLGAPTKPDLAEWRTYMETQALGRPKSGELGQLRAELLREQIDRERRRNQIEARTVVTIEECCTAARRATTSWAAVLTAKLEQEAPARLVGKAIAECRAELCLIHDEMIESFNEIFRRESPQNPPILEK